MSLNLRCWPGVFLVKGQVYQNQESQNVVVSLGFRDYAALAIPLDTYEQGGQAPLVQTFR